MAQGFDPNMVPERNRLTAVESPKAQIYYQRSTTNKSFIEMSEYLRMIGIENYRWPLALLNPNLAGVDPFDPNLPYQTKCAILVEVKNNPIYFFREVVRIPSSGEPSKFILNRGNMALIYIALMSFNVYLIMPRQTGKTIAYCTLDVYFYNFGMSNSTIALLNKEARDTRLNLSRIRAIRDLLPAYLRFDAVYAMNNSGKKVKVQSTTTFMENAFTNNKIKTYGKARNEMAAANLLRGETLQQVIFDEIAFQDFNKVIYTNMIPAMSKAVEIARRNNTYSGIIFTTTPSWLTTDSGRWAYEMMENATKFNEKWYDLNYYQIKSIIDSNRMSNFVFIQFSYTNLGYDDAWLFERAKESNWQWVDIRREYLLEWSRFSENCPFTKDELDVIKKFCREPKKTIMIFGKYPLVIYKEIPLKSNLVPKYPPIMGVDPAGGYSRDFSCITIIDSKTTEVFAELQSNTISLIDLARVIEYIVLNMMPNAVVNVEANSFGTAVIAKLKESQIKRNLYYEIKDKLCEEKTINGQLERVTRRVRAYGTTLNHDIRNQFIELLRERVNFHKDKFISPTIHKEMTQMEVKKNGRVEHSDLSHDDQVFSYLHALWVWYHGVDLREKYGLEKFEIKTEDSNDEIIDLETGPARGMADMSRYIEQVNRPVDDVNRNRLEIDLARLNEGKGLTLAEFVNQQRKKEDEHLRMMLKDSRLKEAYARYYGVHPDTVDPEIGRSSYDDATGNLPNSLFMDFNKDIEEMDNSSIYKNMPSSFVGQYGTDMSAIEDETQQ